MKTIIETLRPAGNPPFFKEHDAVRTITSVETEGERILKGTEGTVVSIYRNAYAVEFVRGKSDMVVVTIYASQLEAART